MKGMHMKPTESSDDINKQLKFINPKINNFRDVLEENLEALKSLIDVILNLKLQHYLQSLSSSDPLGKTQQQNFHILSFCCRTKHDTEQDVWT